MPKKIIVWSDQKMNFYVERSYFWNRTNLKQGQEKRSIREKLSQVT